MERKVFGLSKQEKLFEPHTIFKKLQQISARNEPEAIAREEEEKTAEINTNPKDK